MEQYPYIPGSVPAPDEDVSLHSCPDAVAVGGTIAPCEEVFLRTESQHVYQRGHWSGIVARGYPLPQGQAVPWTEIPQQRTKKMMDPKLEHLIDRVLAPILVTRYLNRLKNVSLKSENAK